MVGAEVWLVLMFSITQHHFGAGGWVSAIEVLKGVEQCEVSWFLLHVFVEGHWVIRLRLRGVLVGEAPGFKTQAVWFFEADLQEVLVNLGLPI